MIKRVVSMSFWAFVTVSSMVLYPIAVVIWAAFLWIPSAQGFKGESSRIVFFHVPMAWIAVLAFLVSCVTSVMYLKRREPKDDIRASVSAGLGLWFLLSIHSRGLLCTLI